MSKPGEDWTSASDYLPGYRFLNDSILIKDNKGTIQVMTWGSTSTDLYWSMDSGAQWKKLPEGHCPHCGAGRAK